jgi:uncharacterized protein
METPIPVDLGRIAQDLQIKRIQVESVVQLLDEGNTVPFITRYRKERTGGLNEVVIREIQFRVTRQRELAERKETILRAVEAQGKLSEDLAAAIRAADNPKRLEDLYLPFKPKKRTKASEAREKGLEPLAVQIWNRDEALTDLVAAASNYLSTEKGIETPEQALEGVGHILAESVSELAPVRDAVRRVVWKIGKLVTAKSDKVPEGQGLDFRDYFNYSEPIHHIPPHRVLALNRGEKDSTITVKLDVPRPELERAMLAQLMLDGHPHQEFFARAAIDALERLLLPSLEREVRRDLTEMAEHHAVDVFARNLRSLLLQPPIASQVVLALDPGFRTGCKVSVMDPQGQLLAHEVIHPHQPQNRRSEAKLRIKDLVAKYGVGVVAIGNGTACRETEELVAEVIAEGTYFHANPGATHMPGAAPQAAPTSAPEAVESPSIEAEASTGAEGQVEPSGEPIVAEAVTATDEAPTGEPAVAEAVTSTSTPETEPEAASPGEPGGEESLPPISGGGPEEDEALAATSNGPDAPGLPSESEPAADGASAGEHAVPIEGPIEHAVTVGGVPEIVPSVEEKELPTPPEPSGGTGGEGEAPASAATAASTTGEDEIVQPIAADFTHLPVGPKVKPEEAPRPPREKERRPPRPPKVRAPAPPPGPHPADEKIAQLAYVIVNEAGASIYSTSQAGRDEFPDLDATTRSSVSIGRRLQDPLAELVKIEPQSIGVGLYQHDVSPRQLKDSLEQVIESCVNFVGVDLNTASVALLRHVSGLNALTAQRLFDRRNEKGPFTSREQIHEVEGIGPVTFTQAAGFLKVRDGEHPFDRTWVHPESYEAATKLLESIGFVPADILDKDKIGSIQEKLKALDLPAVSATLNVGEPTLRDIVEALARPGRDPREDLPTPIFKKGVLKLEDLTAGMELKGTVLNVVDFGAFVDIGLKDSGLVHISQLANRYIKSPHDVVSVGDVVTVWVMGVDGERKRVSLTMVPPGTERPRGGPPGGRGGRSSQGGGGDEGGPAPQQGERGPRGGGGERREGGGPPRPPRGGGERREGGGPPRRDGGGEGQAAPQRGLRVPGPPQRMQGGRGRGGPGGAGGGNRRFDRARQDGPPPASSDVATEANKPKPKPSGPQPLSKDALSGNAPLRSFGQLKQFLELKTKPEDDETNTAPSSSPAPDKAQPDTTAPASEAPGGDPTPG